MDTVSPALPAQKVVARIVSKRRLQIRILRKQRKGSDGHGPSRLSELQWRQSRIPSGYRPPIFGGSNCWKETGLTIVCLLRTCSLLRPSRRPARARVACSLRAVSRPTIGAFAGRNNGCVVTTGTWHRRCLCVRSRGRNWMRIQRCCRSWSGPLARDRRPASGQLQMAGNNWLEPVQSDDRCCCRCCSHSCSEQSYLLRS